MDTSTKKNATVLEGIFAINKPQWASSAGVLRDLQEHFSRSPLFAPWLESAKRSLVLSKAKEKHIRNLKVKLGHGGTLDPMATGVLIVGIGKGTKCLTRFLECTKSYECVILFGAATDSYDAVGKVVGKAAYEHVTKELVEEKLAQFRGKIMQKPSVFSALKVDGKKMYEYARAGGDIPEVAARPVEVEEMELVEWLEPGSHEYTWPKEEVGDEEMEGAQKLMGIREGDAQIHAKTAAKRGRKRPHSPESDSVHGAGKQPKIPRSDTEPAMSGALPSEENPVETADDNASEPPKDSTTELADTVPSLTELTDTLTAQNSPTPPPNPPAARLRMTVTSGFYVRSLCHDLGLACSSLGLMSSLIRTRQGSYTVNQNVLESSDLEDPAKWEPVVQKQLEEFMEAEGWPVEELEDEETWQAKKKEREAEGREQDRERSYRGGGRNKWNHGKGKYSRNG
ncbi:uridine synthase [Pyrenophora seminiperda CCB06]|uniref:tRNA pseudouridine(55) synthase n=1 Tax=Pyrenophora seminiperda CCB06 TaxID=1302712 RepID=A0A3M7M9V4_9PLEO|nr:uridine synthase [Pyrenophora seminiperda CCB06]